MTYDHACWHTGAHYPADLPEEAAATHIGMFFAWAAHQELVGEEHLLDFEDEFQEELLTRRVTPGQYLLRTTGGQLADSDLSSTGNSFAGAYYGEGHYYADLANVGALIGHPEQYRLPDSWEVYEVLRKVLDSRFKAWRAHGD